MNLHIKTYWQFALLAFMMNGCSGQHQLKSNDALLAKIRSELKPLHLLKKKRVLLNLDSIANFKWDSVYYFTEEVGAHHISNTIGFSWEGPNVPNSYKRLLFVHNHQVVTFIDFNEYSTPDEQVEWPIPIHMWVCTKLASTGRTVCPKNKSYFVVSRSQNRYGIEYAFVPLACLDTPLKDALE